MKAGSERDRADDDPMAKARRSFAAAVAFVAAQPGGIERILKAHRRRPDGYCTGCVHTLSHWPCPVAGIALTAAEQRN